MTSNEIALPSRAPQPARIAQATAVEQSRAVAEVQAAVLVAQQCPRDVQAAIAAMRVSCGLLGLAERAFYRYNRGGKAVTGPTVHLARELARVWGNIDYGFKELSRDGDRSEILAYAWDQETNARNSISVINPHARDTKDGVKELTDLRDIYESNANNAARRLRQTIFAVLPPWFVEEAQELCNRTLQRGADAGQKEKPLPSRIADIINTYAELGVDDEALTRKVGRPTSKWMATDVAQLVVIGKSIRRGETTVEDEFPAPTLTTEEIAAARPPAPAEPAPPTTEPPAPAPVDDPADAKPSVSAAPSALVAKVKDQLARIGVTKPRDQLDVISRVAGERFTRWGDLTTGACSATADVLVRVGHHEPEDRLNALDVQLGEIEDARAESGGGA